EEYYPLDAGRAERKPPKVDPLIYTDHCALAASAFLAAHRFLGEHSFLHRGFVAVDFLWSHLYREGNGMLHYWDGSAHQDGLLSDQVNTATALLDAYEATANPVYLQHAIELAELVRQRFCDTQGGGFFDRVGNLGAPGAPPVKELSENAQAALLYLRLATLIGLESYRDLAESALRAFLAHYQAYGIMAAGYARAIDHYLREPVAIRIVGELHHPQTRALWQKSLGLYALGQFVQMLDPARDSALISQLGLSPVSQPVAYICLGRVCLAPISASEEIQPAIRRYLHERQRT
ncbi:MAG: hypothetical protein HYX89_06680, partial [Chloroflexi bacterium]|nr:hypothetical protein [Chloroflexota bacterium]